ncbi:Mitochondrial uncoupling protein 5 [Linum perenne]
MGVKGFLEGGIASIIVGCSTHPLDLIKVRIQLQGEASAAPKPIHNLRPAFSFNSLSSSIHLPPPHSTSSPIVAKPRFRQPRKRTSLMSLGTTGQDSAEQRSGRLKKKDDFVIY